MRSVPLILSAILGFAWTTSAGEIREFTLPVLEKLGTELSHRDELAANASDLLCES